MDRKTFQKENGKDSAGYAIDVTGARFSQSPAGQPESYQPLNDFGRKIKGLKITVNLDRPETLKVVLDMDDNVTKNDAVFSIAAVKDRRQDVQDDDGRYQMKIFCELSLCEKASIRILEIASSESVDLLYARSYEYLKPGDDEKFDVEAIDEELLREAIEYRFPVERHALRVNGSVDMDVLVIRPPVIDGDSESESDSENIRELELRSGPALYRSGPPARTSNPATAPAPSPVPAPAPSPVARASAVPALRLTPNPFDVYDVRIPQYLIPSGLVSDNPLALASNFDIKPVSEQKEFEPAYRIAVIAQAFVDQNINVYENACNIFVRAVMTLAGYVDGGHYSANHFDLLFRSESQGLNRWEKSEYQYGNSPVAFGRMETQLSGIPEWHGVVVQVDRSRKGAHGHVGIATRIGGKTVFYDSSLRTKRSPGYPPRRQDVDASKLLTPSRSNTNIYSMPFK